MHKGILDTVISGKVLVIFILCFFSSLPANSETVYWGGVSFASWDDRQALFPNTSKFLCRGGGDCVDSNLDSWALGRVLNAEFSAFNLSTDLISPDQIEAVIMTPMITGESLAVVKDITNNKVSYIHVYRIYASLVFFEVGSGRLISAKPVVVQYTDTLPLIADSHAVSQNFARLANPVSGGVNLFDELFKRAVNTSPFSFSEKYARVASINIAPQALSELESTLDINAWKMQVSRQLEAYIVDATNGPLVPSIPGDHLTGEFAATFSSGSKVIKLPSEVGYEFSVDIAKFKEIVKINRKQKTNCHAVKLILRLNGPFDTILEAPLTRTKRSCGVIAADKQLDKTYYFTQSLYSLLKESAASLSAKPNKEFLKRAAPKSKGVDKQFIKAWESALDSSW